MGFVERLVGRTHGGRPALRPVVKPSSVSEGEPVVIDEYHVGQALPHSGEPPEQGRPSPGRSAERAEPAPARDAPFRVTPSLLVPHPVQQRRGTAATDDAQDRSSPARTARLEHHESRDRVGAPPPVHPDAAAAVRADARGETPRIAIRVEGRAAPARAEGGDGSRRSDGAPDAGPPIHIHIGRVDVRAPAPAPVPARRPPEPLPSVALGRYLDEREGRR